MFRRPGSRAGSRRSGSRRPTRRSASPTCIRSAHLSRAELIVVQDAYHPTETTRFADVLLPGGAVVREGGDQHQQRAARLASASRSSRRPAWPCPTGRSWPGSARRWASPGFEFKDSGAVWDEFIGLTAGRPCDMAGMTSARLRHQRHLRWPCPSVDHPGTERLYLDRKFPTPSGRAPLPAGRTNRPARPPDHEFPLVLTTGRLYAHWHTLTRTGKSPKLVPREPSAFVEVHPDDAAELGLAAGAVGRGAPAAAA